VGTLAGELGLDPIACAEGIVRVAETEMLGALAVMTVQRGIDPRRFALMGFGGAGPLHAVALAERLGIARVLCPRVCGVLCALGLAAAAPRRDAATTTMLAGEHFTRERLADVVGRLAERAVADLAGAVERVRVRFELRYRGQSFELAVEQEADPRRLREAFEQEHERRYGYRDEHAEVELVNVRVSAFGPRPTLRLTAAATTPPVHETTRVVFDGEWVQAQLWHGELPAGTRVEGPSLCAMEESTLLVPPGWSGAVDEHGTVMLERDA
jgi:N-methylhydantoinase A